MPRSHKIALTSFCLILALSCVRPPYPPELALQHIPTALFLVGVVLLERHSPVSNRSFGCLLAFMLLHVLGARYIYSYVPYDDWLESLVSARLTEIFSWQRNHYDRLVHFAYGMLAVAPASEWSSRCLRLSPGMSLFTAVQFVLASSAVYELAEWGLALVMAPDWAEAYNGQQGDIWDAQKDMALALVGAVLTATWLAWFAPVQENAAKRNQA